MLRSLKLFSFWILCSCGQHVSRSHFLDPSAQPTPNDTPSPPQISDPIEQMAFAIRDEKIDEVRLLLENGMSPDTKLPNGRPLLHEAIVWQRKEILKLLVERNADRNALDQNGQTAFDVAEDFPELLNILRPEIIIELKQKVFAAVTNNKHADHKVLLSEGADPNWDFENGHSVLTMAIELKFENIVRVLLNPELLTDVNKANQNGEKPLALAKRLNLLRIEKILLQRGATI